MKPNIKQNPTMKSLDLGAENAPNMVINTARIVTTLSSRLRIFISNLLTINHATYRHAHTTAFIVSIYSVCICPIKCLYMPYKDLPSPVHR
jgi:hypothetical protein